MNKEEALELVREKISDEKIQNHCLAVGAIMKKLAENLGENKERWEIIGLLHDLDYDQTAETPERHTLVTEELLKGKIDSDMIRTIKSHNYQNLGLSPERKEDYAIIAADALSGLIITTTLVIPSKKLEDVKVKSVKKKFKQKDFARKINREDIMFCEKLGLELGEFIEIGIEGMKEISDELGL